MQSAALWSADQPKECFPLMVANRVDALSGRNGRLSQHKPGIISTKAISLRHGEQFQASETVGGRMKPQSLPKG